MILRKSLSLPLQRKFAPFRKFPLFFALQNKSFSTRKGEKDLFDKCEKFEDSVHPRQRAGEHSAVQWATQNKQKISKAKMELDLSYLLDHPIWSKEEMLNVKQEHRKPSKLRDWMAYGSVKTMRTVFDILSGYKIGKLTERKVIIRVVFLETVAAVPGMVGAMIRHLHSLRLMRRDYGWIHTLLEEAENERMHLLSSIKLMKPGYFARFLVLLTQGVFVNLWFVLYLFFPKFCHRFVGYLEEEAVKTYTDILVNIEKGPLSDFRKKAAPEIAKKYWRMGPNATLEDLFLAIRADEMHHRDVNHDLADKNPHEANQWIFRSKNQGNGAAGNRD